MNMVVRTKEAAWDEVNRIFPTGYEKDESSSQRAGYPIYRSTAEDHYGYWISDLGNQLEVNMPEQTVNILIRPDDKKGSKTRCEMVRYSEKDGNSQDGLQMLAADIIKHGKTLEECHHVSQQFFPDGTKRVIETGSYCISVLNEVTGIRYWVHFSGCKVTEILECR